MYYQLFYNIERKYHLHFPFFQITIYCSYKLSVLFLDVDGQHEEGRNEENDVG